MLSLAKTLRTRSPARQSARSAEETAAAGTLTISFGDAGWQASVTMPEAGTIWSGSGRCFPDGGANAASAITQAVAAVEKSEVSDSIGSVVLLADDPDLHLLDHRLARLTNFEPRGLKEFGAQQAGGRPVAYASLPFGASSAREIERRILSFLPEDSLEAMFFGLGKFAPSLIALLPGGISCFGSDSTGIFCSLRMHGEFSQLIVGNAETGIIVARRLPFGAFTVARAYGAEHGLDLEPAATALRTRSRLAPAEILKSGDALPPEYRTASNLALAPVLRRIRDEIAATLDYFQFERLAGRPSSLTLAFGGAPISGFVTWLSEAVEMQVELADEEAGFTPAQDGAWPLNLLTGARSGLLKLGSEQFEFVDGRFRPMKPVQTGVAMKAASGLGEQFPILKRLPALDFLQAANSIVITRQQMMGAVAACGCIGLVFIGNSSFVGGPARAALVNGASAYGAAATQSIDFVSRKVAEEGGAEIGRHPLWAEDLASIARGVQPNMRMTRLAYVGTQSGQPFASLQISGALAGESAANLKLVADFIGRLEEDSSFRRRFGEISFTGAAEAPLDGADMNFQVTAKVAGGQPQ